MILMRMAEKGPLRWKSAFVVSEWNEIPGKGVGRPY